MSWMDSWSRPKKSSATPPPLYLTAGEDNVPYCHSCGRVIGSRRSQSAKSAAAPVKYCSDRCKRHKPSTAPGSTDARIASAFTLLLNGADINDLPSLLGSQEPTTDATGNDSGEKASQSTSTGKPQPAKRAKGDPRLIIPCSVVEEAVFGSRADPEKTFGRRRNRARRGVADDEVWRSVDMVDGRTAPNETHRLGDAESDGDGDSGSGSDDEDVDGHTDDSATGRLAKEIAGGGVSLAGRVRPPQAQSDVNGSVGGEKGWAERVEETPEMLLKRREGQKRAEEKEAVKSAARRAVAFGLIVDGWSKEEEMVAGKKGKGKKKGAIGDDSDMGAKQKGAPEEGSRRKCEAVMNGSVVEPSFAKGDWAIRWRER